MDSQRLSARVKGESCWILAANSVFGLAVYCRIQKTRVVLSPNHISMVGRLVARNPLKVHANVQDLCPFRPIFTEQTIEREHPQPVVSRLPRFLMKKAALFFPFITHITPNPLPRSRRPFCFPWGYSELGWALHLLR